VNKRMIQALMRGIASGLSPTLKQLNERIAELEARLAAIEGSKSKKRTGKTT